ncbi:prepilin peptidase [Brachybacterium sp. JHP9]|uniref:Prepilin peptidase n=1 Tax=Brachybacterium equifaecis TaxID=2910770 RepID=A0ABT0R2D6_9MICO|nr:prepilin peptidase [Brachybacterium equifaecis]
MLPASPLVWLPLLAHLPFALVLSAVDLREHRLPNRLVAAMTLCAVATLLIAGAADPGARTHLRFAVVVAVLCAAGGIALALLAPQVIGMGDAKAAPAVALLAAACGPTALLAAALGIALLGGAAGIAVLLATRSGATRFAFGPVLLAGPYLGLLFAPFVESALGLS